MELSNLIQLNRVEIQEETDDFYKVNYRDQEYIILKDSETKFTTNAKGIPSLELRIEQHLIPEFQVFQDKNVPNEFKEVMMFHEIRELEYCDFEDAHERAMNDEVLYTLKFFSPEKRESYHNFAQEYREIEGIKSRSKDEYNNIRYATPHTLKCKWQYHIHVTNEECSKRLKYLGFNISEKSIIKNSLEELTKQIVDYDKLMLNIIKNIQTKLLS